MKALRFSSATFINRHHFYLSITFPNSTLTIPKMQFSVILLAAVAGLAAALPQAPSMTCQLQITQEQD